MRRLALCALPPAGERGMSWRAWAVYDREAEECHRALPLREQYNWRGLILFVLIVALAGAYLWAVHFY